MIAEGVLENPSPQHIFGQHVMPFLPVGQVGFRPGQYMASTDELYLTIRGKGGHGAMPDKTVDPILITAHILVALQQVISRICDPRQPSVLSFGRLEANGATNIIPDEVKVEGTFRAMNEEWRAKAHQAMTKMAVGMAESMGGHCDFQILKGYPFLTNDPALTQKAQQAAIQLLGPANVVELDIWMAAEDFAFFSHERPACFYRLGTRNEQKGIVSGVHTPTFDIDEQALITGTALMTWLTVSTLLSDE